MSYFHPTDHLVTAPLSQRCSVFLKYTANHWYSTCKCPEIPDEPPETRLFLWYHLSFQVHRSSCLHGRREPGRSSVGLSRGFGSSIAPLLHTHHFRIRYLWTASVEHADTHPAVSPTSRAFYSSGSGLLRHSDLVASVTCWSISSLSDSPQ